MVACQNTVLRANKEVEDGLVDFCDPSGGYDFSTKALSPPEKPWRSW